MQINFIIDIPTIVCVGILSVSCIAYFYITKKDNINNITLYNNLYKTLSNDLSNKLDKKQLDFKLDQLELFTTFFNQNNIESNESDELHGESDPSFDFKFIEPKDDLLLESNDSESYDSESDDLFDLKPSNNNKQLKINIPSGLIFMWNGSIDNIPDGFVICDGNNNTPNLINKYVKGSNENSIGTKYNPLRAMYVSKDKVLSDAAALGRNYIDVITDIKINKNNFDLDHANLIFIMKL